jgi:hypothetical protein
MTFLAAAAVSRAINFALSTPLAVVRLFYIVLSVALSGVDTVSTSLMEGGGDIFTTFFMVFQK